MPRRHSSSWRCCFRFFRATLIPEARLAFCVRSRPELRPSANPQGGANGRQPLPSETNRTLGAAASRRSPWMGNPYAPIVTMREIWQKFSSTFGDPEAAGLAFLIAIGGLVASVAVVIHWLTLGWYAPAVGLVVALGAAGGICVRDYGRG